MRTRAHALHVHWRGRRARSVSHMSIGLAVAVCMAFAPATTAIAQVPGHRAAATRERAVDSGIAPGDDFFAYANGAWLEATHIPAGKERWSARDEINDITRERVLQLLDDARTAPRGSLARKVAEFRAALLDERAIDAHGLAALRPLLDSIDRVHDSSALTRMLGRAMRADVDPLNWAIYGSASLLGLSVEPSIHGEKEYVAFLVQGGLGLPDRDDYLSAEPRAVALRQAYSAYVGHLLARTGSDRASQRADAVMALETAIARTHASREASANDRNADTVWTRADFAREAPGMDWSAFFAAAGLAKQDAFVPWQPTAVRGVAALVASQPVERWKDYLRVRAIDSHADGLPRAFARESAEPRAARAVRVTQFAMSDAIGQMYGARYFPPEQKMRVEQIVANVVAAFVRRVSAVPWMSPGTKALALRKLKTLYVGIGYPEHQSDFLDLEVDPADAIGNLRRVAERTRRRAIARLGTPVDMTQWWIAPQSAGAVLVFQQNAYEFSAALLQSPKFDPTASDAANYGAIGAIIGHDVAHFVDVLGAEYEADGRMRRWWAPEDMQRFQAAAFPLLRQYSAYRPFADVAIDGALTQTENVADLAGLAAAFDAYRRSLGDRAADADAVRASDREFFIAFAQSSRSKTTPAGLRAQAASDHHAPDSYRVATVRNLDAWYDAFDVRPGQGLYLEPSARVRIW